MIQKTIKRIHKLKEDLNDNLKRLEERVESLKKTIEILTSAVNNPLRRRRWNSFDDVHKKKDKSSSANKQHRKIENRPLKKDSSSHTDIKKKIFIALRDGENVGSIKKILSTIKIQDEYMKYGYSQFRPLTGERYSRCIY
jgi:phage shock protein A